MRIVADYGIGPCMCGAEDCRACYPVQSDSDEINEEREAHESWNDSIDEFEANNNLGRFSHYVE